MKLKLIQETTFTEGKKCQDRFFVSLSLRECKADLKSCVKMVDATCVIPFPLTNQIGECD